jgi:predicted RNase H-like HicB family nuclease
MTQPRYTVTATREGGWWELDVKELDGVFTQARRLDQAEAMARDVIATMLDVPEDSFDVDVMPTLMGPLAGELAEALRARGEAAEAQETARRATDQAARRLQEEGLPVRDIGRLLGVSYQRAAKLLSGTASAKRETTTGRMVAKGSSAHVAKHSDARAGRITRRT